MGSFLDKPRTEKDTHKEEGNGLRVGVSAMQGWRIDMEDAHTVKLGLPGYPDYNWFAVYDGHGGKFVSQFSAVAAVEKFLETSEWKTTPHTPENLAEGMRKAFLQVDAELLKHPRVASGEDHSGSTAIAALVTPTHIIAANCGDSRAILVRNKQAVALSEDHKPYNPLEEARIVAAGGTVAMRRVNGDLAVSRALGDFVYKHQKSLPPEKQQVSPEPEMKIEVRHPGDEFMVLACDGVWDVMNNQDVADFVHARVNGEGAAATGATDPASSGAAGTITDDMGRLAEALIDDCLEKNSRDNMSAIIVAFAGAPRPSSEAVAASETRRDIMRSQAAGGGTGGAAAQAQRGGAGTDDDGMDDPSALR